MKNYQSFDEQEYTERCRQHVLWGLAQAVSDPDIPEIVQGTVAELSKLTGIQHQRLRRRLYAPDKALPASYSHRRGSERASGPVNFYAWEYITCCFCLGISTNPYVDSSHDRSLGFMVDGDAIAEGADD